MALEDDAFGCSDHISPVQTAPDYWLAGLGEVSEDIPRLLWMCGLVESATLDVRSGYGQCEKKDDVG